MTERPKANQIKAVNDAKKHLQEGAVSFAQARNVDLLAAIKQPQNIIINFHYDPQSRPQIPLDVTNFIKSVYGRVVDLRSITTSWLFTKIIPDEGKCEHDHRIEMAMEIPFTSIQTGDTAILNPKRDRYIYPTIRIDLDGVPFRYAVREVTSADHITKKNPFGDFVYVTLRPQVIWAIGDILGGLEDKFTPRSGLAQRVHDVMASKFFPELYAPIKPPLKGISIIDSG